MKSMKPLARYPGNAHIHCIIVIAVPSGRLFSSEHLGHLRRCFLATPPSPPQLLRCPHDSNLVASHSSHVPPSLSPHPGKPPLKHQPLMPFARAALPVVFHIPSSVRRRSAVRAATLCPARTPAARMGGREELCLRCHFPISGLTLSLPVATSAEFPRLLKE